MTEAMVLSQDELVSNPTARVPVCLCLDVSGSMGGAPIEELNEGVAQFFAAVSGDELARYAAEIAVVTFGNSAQKVVDFGAVSSQQAPRLSADGSTPMGEGVNLALDLLEARKREYSQAGIDYYQPWLVLMTDGAPTDAIQSAVQRAAKLAEARKLSVFAIGIGPAANMDVLASFSPRRPPLRLQGLRFQEFFEWLSRSVARVSQSIPGQSVPLDQKGIAGWAEL